MVEQSNYELTEISFDPHIAGVSHVHMAIEISKNTKKITEIEFKLPKKSLTPDDKKMWESPPTLARFRDSGDTYTITIYGEHHTRRVLQLLLDKIKSTSLDNSAGIGKLKELAIVLQRQYESKKSSRFSPKKTAVYDVEKKSVNTKAPLKKPHVNKDALAGNPVHQVEVLEFESKSGGKNKKYYVKKTPDKKIAEVESFSAHLSGLLLGHHRAPKTKTLVDDNGQRLGVRSKQIEGYKPFSGIMRDKNYDIYSPAERQKRLIQAGIAKLLVSAYILEENDLHYNNFGFDKEGDIVWIDYDQTLRSKTQKYSGVIGKHYSSNIDVKDIQDFPNITTSKPAHWLPRGHAAFHTREKPAYSDQLVALFKDIEKNPEFIKEKYQTFLKFIVMDRTTIENIARACLSTEKAIQEYVDHIMQRIENIKEALLLDPGFIQACSQHQADYRKNIIAEFTQYNDSKKDKDQELRVDIAAIDQKLNQYLSPAIALKGKLFSVIDHYKRSKKDIASDRLNDINEIKEIIYSNNEDAKLVENVEKRLDQIKGHSTLRDSLHIAIQLEKLKMPGKKVDIKKPNVVEKFFQRIYQTSTYKMHENFQNQLLAQVISDIKAYDQQSADAGQRKLRILSQVDAMDSDRAQKLLSALSNDTQIRLKLIRLDIPLNLVKREDKKINNLLLKLNLIRVASNQKIVDATAATHKIKTASPEIKPIVASKQASVPTTPTPLPFWKVNKVLSSAKTEDLINDLAQLIRCAARKSGSEYSLENFLERTDVTTLSAYPFVAYSLAIMQELRRRKVLPDTAEMSKLQENFYHPGKDSEGNVTKNDDIELNVKFYKDLVENESKVINFFGREGNTKDIGPMPILKFIRENDAALKRAEENIKSYENYEGFEDCKEFEESQPKFAQKSLPPKPIVLKVINSSQGLQWKDIIEIPLQRELQIKPLAEKRAPVLQNSR